MSVAFQRVKLPHAGYRDLLADIGDTRAAVTAICATALDLTRLLPPAPPP